MTHRQKIASPLWVLVGAVLLWLKGERGLGFASCVMRVLPVHPGPAALRLRKKKNSRQHAPLSNAKEAAVVAEHPGEEEVAKHPSLAVGAVAGHP